MASTLAVYASCRPLGRLRKTRFRSWLAFPDGFGYPLDYFQKFPPCGFPFCSELFLSLSVASCSNHLPDLG